MRPIILTLFLLTACTALPITPIPTPAQPLPDLQPAIDGGLAFLHGQYNEEYGLLQESPEIGQHRYYLTNDNLLAAHVLERYGETDLAATLRASLERHNITGNGFIEIAFGEVERWPPYHHQDEVVEQHGDDQILFEAHRGPGYFSEWSGFSNLACMGIVNEINGGYLESGRRLYAIQMASFDGHGWPDIAYQRRDGVYETLGLAWCLYAGALLGQPDLRVLDQLLAQQGEHGGFYTHYRVDAPQLADPNIETISVALLAIHTLQHGPPSRFGFAE